MKKLLATFFAIVILFSLQSCGSKNKGKIQGSENNIVDSNELPKDNKLYLSYSGYDECIYWTKIETADYYEVQFDQGKENQTEDKFYTTENLKIGNHNVIVKAIKDNQTITTENLSFKIEGITEEDIEKNKKKIFETEVEIYIEKYNLKLGFIKTDKITDGSQGIICKKQGNEYWAICYSALLQSSTKYDKTDITIEDEYGNKYKGKEINPTGIKEKILTVVSFTSEKELPVVDFNLSLCDSRYLVKVSKGTNPRASIGKYYGNSDFATIEGKKTKNILVMTTFESAKHGSAIFNQRFELIGIVVENPNSNRISFIQGKEILLYIDKELAERSPEWVSYP